jgi:HAD superfamily hydrolase (TIGR01509 family)
VIKAAIFDLDGLLVNSQPMWEEAAAEVFGALGVPLTPENMKHAIGLRSDEEVRYWHGVHPWPEPTQEVVLEQYEQKVISLIHGKAEPMPGAALTVAECRSHGLRLAVASSSSTLIIRAELEKAGLLDAFEVIKSAEHEPYGKPHPGVYISTADMLRVHPEECIAFEDSFHGVLAAKAAKMRCIAVPDSRLRNDRRFAIADAVLGSLTQFTSAMIDEKAPGTQSVV